MGSSYNTTFKPANPFHQKIADIVRLINKDEIPIILDQMVDVRVEKIMEEQVPIYVAAELHRMLEGGEMKRGPGGRRINPISAQSSVTKKERKKIGPRPRCKTHNAAKNKSDDGVWECKRCAKDQVKADGA